MTNTILDKEILTQQDIESLISLNIEESITLPSVARLCRVTAILRPPAYVLNTSNGEEKQALL